MKDLKNFKNAHYSAREIIEILDHAKKLGVKQLKIEGFEATWELVPPRSVVPAPAPQRQGVAPVPQERERNGEICSVHDVELTVGNWGRPYCVECYKERKDGRRGRDNARTWRGR